MRETLAILKKDVRRLWWQIAAMLAMCATVGCLDARRAASSAGIVEGLLDIAIPLAWACLIAQAIHAEALVGDREFWMTRPHRWGCLLGAKALFVALCVHLPSLVTDAAILAARGYNLIDALPQLLVKQLLLAGGLTLPAMALAALVGNLTQFVVGLPVLLAAFAGSAGLQHSVLFGYKFRAIGHPAIAILAVASVSIVVLQYRQRRTRLARILALSTLLVVGLLTPVFAYRQEFALNTLAMPAANIHATMTLAAPDPRAVHGPFGQRVFTTLPFKVTGLPESNPAWMASVSMEISTPNGVRYRYDPPRADFDTGLTAIQHGSTSLFLGMQHAAYDRIRDSKVTISGTIGFVVYARGPEVRMPVGGAREVTASMHCSSAFEEAPYDGPRVIVFCDTPSPYGVLAEIRLDEETKHWMWPDPRPARPIGSFVPGFGWLSPLQRRQQSFRVGVRPDSNSNRALDDASILIVPERLAGYSTVSFQATDVDLREYSR